jgi:hypothetical protein
VLTKSLVNWIKSLWGHHHRAIHKVTPKMWMNSIDEAQKAKAFLSLFIIIVHNFCTKRNYYIDPHKKTWESRGAQKAPKKNTKKPSSPSSWAHFCSQFMHKRILKQYDESLVSSSGEWIAHTHTHTHTHTRVAMAYAHKPNLYNNTECAPCGKCAWGYVIVCSSLVRCASLQHCIAFNVFHVLFWFTLHSVVFHHKFKLGYFTTSIIGHNVHIIFIVLWNNCWVFVCYPKKFTHLLLIFLCYPKKFIHLLISFVCYPKQFIHLLIFFCMLPKKIHSCINNFCMLTKKIHSFINKCCMLPKTIHSFTNKFCMLPKNIHSFINKFCMLPQKNHSFINIFCMLCKKYHLFIDKFSQLVFL